MISGPNNPAMNVNYFNSSSLDSIRKFDCGLIFKGIGIDDVIKVNNVVAYGSF